MTTGSDWSAWHKERASFKARESEGFTEDIEALEAHIKKLIEVCPKDKAGWPNQEALLIIDKLTKQHQIIENYLKLNAP